MSIDYKKFENEEIEFNDDTINLIKCIGHGGNSVVYKCKYKDDYYAIKFFIGNKKSRYDRFKQETDKIERINAQKINFTPAVICKNFPDYKQYKFIKLDLKFSQFYIMEIGEKYNYSKLDFYQKLNNIIFICNMLKELHSLDIQHRDIKPENITRYDGKLTFIDYGTAKIPGLETIDEKEPMGSKGTMAPEMFNQAAEIPEYDFCKADIYSIGKIIWIILKNDRNAHKFTTYEIDNPSCKIYLNDIDDGIVMKIEQILIGATQENFFNRISLNNILEDLELIKNKLIGNNYNCNIMKLNCILDNFKSSNHDAIIIKDKMKVLEFVKKVNNIGLKLSLEEDEKELCKSVHNYSFSIKPDSNGYFYFILNDVKYIFDINSIIVDCNKIKITTRILNEIILEENTKYIRDMDSFSRNSILISQIDSVTDTIYLDYDICLSRTQFI